MRNIFLAVVAAIFVFTVSPAFSASQPSLKEVGMFADEYVGRTFTFDAWIYIRFPHFTELKDGSYGISLCDEDQNSLTQDDPRYGNNSTKLFTIVNKAQAKELIRTLEDPNKFYKRKFTFKVTREKHYNGHMYYAGRISSIKRIGTN